MSDIQTISQGNYILHNIDAKKLYVQEPLFTANSGDAVYVGWRPDETVLYSGTAGQVSVSLSEPMTNFEKLKIKLANYEGDNGCQYVEVPAVPSAIRNLTYNAGGGGNFYFVGLYCSADENSITVTKEAALVKAFGSTAYQGQAEVTGYKYALHEVIGVNRKENA